MPQRVLEQGQDLLKAGRVSGLKGCGVGMRKRENSKNLTGEVLGNPYTLPSSTDGETETQRKKVETCHKNSTAEMKP